ncbi:TLDc [Artemisia annua]|uniref:TLDc n=1 Tax=Artemisia annua TaxID=35608 RepID=A0A2U1PJJ8_ARTAN|nr:TLDc [Artemisia annua]
MLLFSCRQILIKQFNQIKNRVLMIQLSLQSSSRSLYRAKTTIEVFVTKKLKKSEMLSQTQECFELSIDCQSFEAPFKPETFPALLHYIGRSIVDQFFLAENYGLNWISFLNGYTKCCGRMPTSTSLIILLKVFQMVVVKSGATTRLQVESCECSSFIQDFQLPHLNSLGVHIPIKSPMGHENVILSKEIRFKTLIKMEDPRKQISSFHLLNVLILEDC